MHEVPARSKSVGRTVVLRDKKESVLRKRDGGRKGSSSRRDSWNRKVVIVGRKDWDSSSSIRN